MRAKNIEGLKKYFVKIGYISSYETSACIDLIFALELMLQLKRDNCCKIKPEQIC